VEVFLRFVSIFKLGLLLVGVSMTDCTQELLKFGLEKSAGELISLVQQIIEFTYRKLFCYLVEDLVVQAAHVDWQPDHVVKVGDDVGYALLHEVVDGQEVSTDQDRDHVLQVKHWNSVLTLHGLTHLFFLLLLFGFLPVDQVPRGEYSLEFIFANLFLLLHIPE
jgi:hypothetical protein